MASFRKHTRGVVEAALPVPSCDPVQWRLSVTKPLDVRSDRISDLRKRTSRNTSHVRRGNHIGQSEERIIRRNGLLPEHIQTCAGNLPAQQRSMQRLEVHQPAAGYVYQVCATRKTGKFMTSDHIAHL